MGSLFENEANEINKNDFVQYALDHKLLDATEANVRRKKKEKEDRIDRLERYKRQSSIFPDDGTNDQTSGGLFCCLRSSDRSSSRSPVRNIKPATMEMVEIAFRKFDRNGDGVLDWEEFQQVGSQGDHLSIKGYYNIVPFILGFRNLHLLIIFLQVSSTVDQEQLRRIFETCDQVSKITRVYRICDQECKIGRNHMIR